MLPVAEAGATPQRRGLRSVRGEVFQAAGRPVELYGVIEALPRLKQVQAELLALQCGAPEIVSEFCPLAVIGAHDAVNGCVK